MVGGSRDGRGIVMEQEDEWWLTAVHLERAVDAPYSQARTVQPVSLMILGCADSSYSEDYRYPIVRRLVPKWFFEIVIHIIVVGASCLGSSYHPASAAPSVG